MVGRVYWPGEERTCAGLGRRVPVLAWGGEYLYWPGEESTCVGLGREVPALTWGGEVMWKGVWWEVEGTHSSGGEGW